MGNSKNMKSMTSKKSIILDSSIVVSLSEQNALKVLSDYNVFITPTNLFEIFTHSQSKKVPNYNSFIKSKLHMYKSLNAKFLPDRDTLIKKELYNVSDEHNKNIFSKFMDQLLNTFTISSPTFKKNCIQDPIQTSKEFANEVEKLKIFLRKYCTDPLYEKERIALFGKTHLNYDKERLQIFDKLTTTDINVATFINNLIINRSGISNITEKDIKRFAQFTFIKNLYYSFKQLQRRIIERDRKAEKGDYFDFEFLMYICSDTLNIDSFVTKNKRDFQNLLPEIPQLQQKIMTIANL